MRSFENWVYSRIFPSFSWGIFGHVTRLGQSRVSKKIWWIIRTNMRNSHNNTHNLALAHDRVSSSSVVELDHGGSWVQIPSGTWDFFRVYFFPRIYIIWCCCYFSVSILAVLLKKRSVSDLKYLVVSYDRGCLVVSWCFRNRRSAPLSL